MGPQTTSGNSPQKRAAAGTTWIALGLLTLLVAVGVGFFFAGAKPISERRGAETVSVSTPEAVLPTPASGGDRSLNRAEISDWIERLEPHFVSWNSTASGAATPADRRWQAWLSLRALGPRASENAQRATAELLAEDKVAAPALVGPEPRLAVITALLESKMPQPATIPEAVGRLETHISLAFRIDALGLAELNKPHSQTRPLLLSVQRGLSQLHQGIRHVREHPSSADTEDVLGVLQLSQALFRAAPLVRSPEQELQVRRAFWSLARVSLAVERSVPAESLLLRAALTESLASYVHVQQQSGSDRQNRSAHSAITDKLSASTNALLSQLAEDTDELDSSFNSRYALAQSVRALRFTRSVLAN